VQCVAVCCSALVCFSLLQSGAVCCTHICSTYIWSMGVCADMYTYVRLYVYATCMWVCECTWYICHGTQQCSHVHPWKYPPADLRTFARTCTHTHIQTHACLHTARTRTHKHTHARACKRARTHARALTHSLTHKRTQLALPDYNAHHKPLRWDEGGHVFASMCPTTRSLLHIQTHVIQQCLYVHSSSDT